MITYPPKQKRNAFTLIELLIVIAIIAVLVALSASAVFQVYGKIPQMTTANDISQMQSGMAAFMIDYQITSPPPSFLQLCEDGAAYYNTYGVPQSGIQARYVPTITFFRQLFGKNFNPFRKCDWNGNGTIDPPYVLEGQQCLVFYLGGIPSYSTNGTVTMTGFGLSNMFPDASIASSIGERKGPYFMFLSKRLVIDKRFPNFPVYYDGWLAKKQPQPYAFFSTNGIMNLYNPLTQKIGGDCPSIGANAYFSGFNTVSGQPTYVNQDSFQIISAGRDGIFGYDKPPLVLGGVSWNPTSGTVGSNNTAGNDDQANFSSSTLGSGQQ